MALLRLIPIAPVASDLDTAWLGAEITRRIGLPCIEAAPLPLQPAWRKEGGEALQSASIVDYLIDRFPQPPYPVGQEWTLALTDRDLVVPGRPYVFGEAALGGAWAVVGIFRLRAPARSDGEEVLRARLLKESLHELGHLAGLPHCGRCACVMAPSAAPADVDRKPEHFCDPCLGRFDTLVRACSAR